MTDLVDLRSCRYGGSVAQHEQKYILDSVVCVSGQIYTYTV